MPREICKYQLTLSEMRSESSWHSRYRNEFGSLVNVVFAVRKYVPPTLRRTHWFLHLCGMWFFVISWEFVSLKSSAIFGWQTTTNSSPIHIYIYSCLCAIQTWKKTKRSHLHCCQNAHKWNRHEIHLRMLKK